MDSSSEEDVKKKGWLLVNNQGSIETSSDEEVAPNKTSSSEVTGLDVLETTREDMPILTSLHLESDSPNRLSTGSVSSEGSTLVSGLPSPLPSRHRKPGLDSVEENLSSVVNILKANVEKEDSLSIDSFDVLSEGADGGYSVESQDEDLLDEEDELLQPTSQHHQFISDSDSDFVRLKEPSEMESVHPGIEVLSQAPQSRSPDLISSSPEPTPVIPPRPKNAPYEDVQGHSSEEGSDHVRIMSRRWPTEDGGFLLVQRFRKLEQDAASTVSSLSDFSSFSMVGSRQRLLSHTQEEGEESDVESDVSDSSFASEETLPVNVTVRNILPAVRQYLHHRNDVFNNKLTFFAILVLTAGLTLGIGHFVGSSQMATHHESVQEGQKLRLRSLQDELVSCMDKRREASKLLLERERDVDQCWKELKEAPESIVSSVEEEESRSSSMDDFHEPRLCGHCQEGQLRYSKFCNIMCSSDKKEGYTWVTMHIFNNPTVDESLNGFNDKERTVALEREEQIVSTAKTDSKEDGYLDESKEDGYLDESEATEDNDDAPSFDGLDDFVLPDYTDLNSMDESDEPGMAFPLLSGDRVRETMDDGNIAGDLTEANDRREDLQTHYNVGVPVGQVSTDDSSPSRNVDLQGPNGRHEEPSTVSAATADEKQTSGNRLEVDDSAAKWICIDVRHGTCLEWVPKEEVLYSSHKEKDNLEVSREERRSKVIDGHGVENCKGGCQMPQRLESEGVNSQIVVTEEMGRKVDEDQLQDLEDASAVKSSEEDAIFQVSSLQEAFQSAWDSVENASKSFLLERNISLHDASEIMKDGAKDLKRVVETSWESIQSAAVQVNENHIQPMVSKVTQLVDRHLNAKRGRKGNKNRGGYGHVRKQKQKNKWAHQSKRRVKNEKSTKEKDKKQNQKASEKIFFKEENSGRTKQSISSKLEKSKVNPDKSKEKKDLNTERKAPQVSQNQKLSKKKSATVKKAKQDTTTLNQPKTPVGDNGNQQAQGKLPPKLNIEKLLDSLDMSCGGEVRCVENHKMDAARLLKEMIGYRQWLWEQRFRKDVDEVEDFMEELEEFIEEENIDDDDIEDLKEEFEDMVEDIQKTTKKFFKKQGNEANRENLGKKNKNRGKNKIAGKKLKETLDGSEQKEGKRNDGGVASAGESVQRVTFSIEDLPSLQLANSSSSSLSDSEDEINDGGAVVTKVKLPSSKENPEIKPSLQKQAVIEYVNTDQWFFRRAQDRELRRGRDKDTEWYFKRFRLWEEDRKMREQKDWYFQRGRKRETSRGCSTQPMHCDWAKDESVVTVWEMYKWLTERFSIRADLRAWNLEDQINWFLCKP
ncbi:uncharacterized protein [Apostichopus japonicus]